MVRTIEQHFLPIVIFLLISVDGAEKEKSKKQEPRNALILAGAMSHIKGIGHYANAEDLYKQTAVAVTGTPWTVCANTVKKHVIEHNGAVTDVFQHSWNPNLEGAFEKAYLSAPFERLVGSYTGAFEDNRPYEQNLKGVYSTADSETDWNQVSWSISMSKAAMLMFQAEVKRNVTYDRVIFMRPDVLIIGRDLTLAKLPRGMVHCTTFNNGNGDFHFVMEHKHAEAIFKLHYRSPYSPTFQGHGWMKTWMADMAKTAVVSDNQIFAGIDEEVYRKVRLVRISPWCTPPLC